MKVKASVDTILSVPPHVARLTAGVERELPELFRGVAQGDPNVQLVESSISVAKPEPRAEMSLEDAVLDVLSRGQPAERTDSGRPTVGAVSKRVGRKVTVAEINDVVEALG